MSLKNKNVLNIGLAFTFTVIYVILLICLLPKPYYTNDQVLMRDIASGVYTGTPDAHLIYIMYPLGLIFKGLYSLIGAIKWYDIFMYLVYPVSFFLLTYKLFRTFDRLWVKLLCGASALVCILSIGAHFYVQNEYTLDAGILAAVGILYLFPWHEETQKERIFRIIVVIVEFTFALWLRKNVFLLSLPIVALSVLFLVIKGTKVREFLKPLIPIAVIFFASIGMETYAYSSPEWKEFTAFNDARTLVFDYYWFPEYYENEELYSKLNISVEEYNSISEGLGLMDELDAGSLTQLANVNRAKVTPIYYQKSELLHTLADEIVSTIKQPVGAVMLLLGVFLIYVIIRFSLNQKDKKILFLLELPVLTAIYVCTVIVYFSYLNRFPERVSLGLYYMVAAAFLGGLLDTGISKAESLKNQLSISIASVLALLIGLVTVRGNILESKENADFWSACIDENKVVNEYCSENQSNLYFVSADISKYSTDRMLTNDYETAENLLTLNYWTLESPLFETRLGNLNLKSLKETLLTSDNLYFIAIESENLEWFTKLSESYGRNIELVKCDETESLREKLVVYRIEDADVTDTR